MRIREPPPLVLLLPRGRERGELTLRFPVKAGGGEDEEDTASGAGEEEEEERKRGSRRGGRVRSGFGEEQGMGEWRWRRSRALERHIVVGGGGGGGGGGRPVWWSSAGWSRGREKVSH
jgi:hypothetical protein